MAEKKQSMDGYYAAMSWLYEHRPHMMSYIASLGAPRSDRRCDRAMVVASADMKPKLYVNDEFLQEIGPAQAAAVLVHEWRHVLLDHLGEAAHPKPAWRYPRVLDDVHEVVINDNIELSGYELPDDVIRGENRGPHFYGYWDTDQAYGPMERWYLDQQPPQSQEDGGEKQDQEDDSDSEQSEDSGEGQSDQSESGSGQGQSQSGQGASDDSADSSSGAENSDGAGSADGSASESSSGSEENSPENAEDASSGSTSSEDSAEAQDGEDSAAGETGATGDGAESSSDGVDGDDSDKSAPSDSEDSDGEDTGDSAGTTEGTGTADGAQDDAADSEGDGKTPGSCDFGAFIEDENGDLREMDETEIDKFRDALNQIKITAISQSPMPKDEQPTEGELDAMDQDVAAAIDPNRRQPYSKAGHTADPAEEILAGGKLHLGWLKLLQRINPKVGKSSGKLNAKASYNWARPRRSTSLIRGANLPTAGSPRDQGAGTTHRPVAMIALDFSSSIDRRLAHAMKDMAQSIPEEHIDARCFTFSTVAVPFDHKASKNRTAGGGTDFSCLELEARKIQQETGEYPYVICLTDGEAWFEGYDYNTYRKNAGARPTDAQLATHWLWVDVLTEDDSLAFKSGKAFPQVMAQRNKSGLPYDRSKL